MLYGRGLHFDSVVSLVFLLVAPVRAYGFKFVFCCLMLMSACKVFALLAHSIQLPVVFINICDHIFWLCDVFAGNRPVVLVVFLSYVGVS